MQGPSELNKENDADLKFCCWNFFTGSWPKNTDKGRKLLIRYFNHIFHKKIQIFHFFGRQKKPLIRVENYWWDNFITFLTIKSNFFIFTAGDQITDKDKITDKPLIRPENHWKDMLITFPMKKYIFLFSRQMIRLLISEKLLINHW